MPRTGQAMSCSTSSSCSSRFYSVGVLGFACSSALSAGTSLSLVVDVVVAAFASLAAACAARSLRSSASRFPIVISCRSQQFPDSSGPG